MLFTACHILLNQVDFNQDRLRAERQAAFPSEEEEEQKVPLAEQKVPSQEPWLERLEQGSATLWVKEKWGGGGGSDFDVSPPVLPPKGPLFSRPAFGVKPRLGGKPELSGIAARLLEDGRENGRGDGCENGRENGCTRDVIEESPFPWHAAGTQRLFASGAGPCRLRLRRRKAHAHSGGMTGYQPNECPTRATSDSHPLHQLKQHNSEKGPAPFYSVDLDQLHVPGPANLRMDTLMSPPPDSATSSVEGCNTRATNSADTHGFFILRKDSERRQQLINVLTEDSDKLCKYWSDAVSKDPNVSQLQFTKTNMMILLGGVRDYINDLQQKAAMAKAVETLTNNGVDLSDETIRAELLTVMYAFHDAAFRILKERGILPHSIFAFDNFLRGATQAAVDCIASPDRLDMEDGITPEAPLSSSSRSPQEEKRFFLYSDYQSLQEKRGRLMQELISAEKSFQKLLETMVVEKNQNTSMLKQMFETRMDVAQHLSQTPSLKGPPIDPALEQWLQRHDCADTNTIAQFAYQGYCLSDVLELVERIDLRKMDLRGGIQCRLWRAICTHRSSGGGVPATNGNHLPGNSWPAAVQRTNADDAQGAADCL